PPPPGARGAAPGLPLPPARPRPAKTRLVVSFHDTRDLDLPRIARAQGLAVVIKFFRDDRGLDLRELIEIRRVCLERLPDVRGVLLDLASELILDVRVL